MYTKSNKSQGLLETGNGHINKKAVAVVALVEAVTKEKEENDVEIQ
jgi:hypothetical protein